MFHASLRLTRVLHLVAWYRSTSTESAHFCCLQRFSCVKSTPSNLKRRRNRLHPKDNFCCVVPTFASRFPSRHNVYFSLPPLRWRSNRNLPTVKFEFTVSPLSHRGGAIIHYFANESTLACCNISMMHLHFLDYATLNWSHRFICTTY